MSEYTPGPWRVGIDRESVGEVNPPEAKIAMTREGTTPEREANARLIAAAPDLLEALHKIVNNWDNLHPKDRQQARAATAKAEGRGQ